MLPRTPAGSLAAALAVTVLAAAAPAPAVAQSADNPAIPAYDGPPPPVPPAVVSRDAEGRVTIRAVRLDRPIDVDGLLDEAVYHTSPAIADFVQQEPREGEPATEQTDVWLFFDDRHVYVAARCWDSQPDRMVANEMRRDHMAIFMNENFAVILDTFYDRRNGFLFHTNPVGGMFDGYVTDERDTARDWNTVWQSKSRRFERGWTVEMAIPFKSLRYRGSGPQIWGVNFRRIVRWKNEMSYLTRIPASFWMRGLNKLSSAATLVGLETPGGAKNLEIKPYAISGISTDRAATPPVTNDPTGDVGVDVKYGLTDGLTLDFSYNTDFAQVEDDDQQVNLTRFSLFFPEKRDFFLEGQGIFSFGGAQGQRPGGGMGGGGGGGAFGGQGDTPVIFFSRRIGLSAGRRVPIDIGGRLTGRVGKYSVGVLNIQTGDEPNAGAVATNFSVVRLKRDVLRRSSVGLIATRRAPAAGGGGDDNLALGLDANLSFFDNLTIVGYYAKTRTPGLEGRDESYRAELNYNGDRYGVQLEHLFVGDDFNPEVGFLRREDFRRNFAQLRFSPRPASIPAVRKFTYEGSFDYTTDAGGRLETRQAQLTFRSEFQSGDQWSVEYDRSFEYLPEPFRIATDVTVPVGGYSFQNLRTSYQLGPQRPITGWLNVQHGSFYSGERTEVGYRGRVELDPKLSLEPGISMNWIDLAEGRFTTKVISTRASLTFTPRTLLAALIQYNSSRHALTSNLRFRWEYQPGSDLYIVYSEGRDTLASGFPTVQDRSFVVKLTRLFRF